MIRDFLLFEEKLNPKNFRIIDVYKGSFWNILFTINDQTGEEFVIRSLRHDFIICHYDKECLERFYTSKLLKIPGVVNCKGYRLFLTEKQKQNRQIIKTIQYTNQSGHINQIDISGPLFYTELIPKGSISKYTIEYLNSKGQNNEIMNPTVRSKIIFGVAAIMKQVHKRKIINKYLNISNIFLDEKLEPKIDGLYFPFEQIHYELETEIMASVEDVIFRSPELMEDEYTYSCDVYSYGVILYYLFAGNLFFQNYKRQHRYKILKKVFNGEFFTKKEMIPDVYWDLIKQCLDNDATKRPTFEQITNILMDDKFALNEFGMKTNLEQLHEYQQRINIL